MSDFSSNRSLMREIEQFFQDFSWDYEGIQKSNGERVEIPDSSRCVSDILEYQAVEKLEEFFSDKDIDIIEPEHSRQYPDATLVGDDINGEYVALDIKTGRKDGDVLDNRLTLGNYSGYFSSPNEDSSYTRFRYGDYDEHFVLAILYEWNKNRSSLNMVSDTEVVVSEKWRIASEKSGSGTTSHIGSVESLDKLRKKNGEFSTKEGFLEFWRED